MKTRFVSQFAAALVLALTGAGQARANVVSVNAALTTSSPQFNRPLAGTPPTSLSAVGTACYYTLQPFYVSAPVSFTLSTTAAAFTTGTADDTFIVLYINNFNPAAPLTNARAANDDSTGNLSSITYALNPGVQYYGLFTTFNSATVGTLTESFNAGTATVTLAAIPEPSTDALLGAGILGAAVLAFRRRKTA